MQEPKITSELTDNNKTITYTLDNIFGIHHLKSKFPIAFSCPVLLGSKLFNIEYDKNKHNDDGTPITDADNNYRIY